MVYIVILLCFLIRLLPRLFSPNQLATDTYFHLHCARAIRANGMRLPEQLPRIAITHRYSYPFLYHYLLALVPNSGRRWFERCTGAFFDTLNGIIAYWFCLWLTTNSNEFQGLDSLPIWVTALFVFSPALLRLGSGPRAYNGSPRVMGQSLYLLHILGAFYAHSTGHLGALVVSILAGAAVIVTAKFSNQVILWFGLFFSVAISWLYLPLVVTSFLLAQLCSRGRALWVIQGQVNHSKYYYKHLQKAFIFPNVRSTKQYISRVKEVFSSLNSRIDIGRILYWYYTESYIWHLFLTVYPHFVIALINGYEVRNDPTLGFLFVWTISGFTGFLLTKFPALHLMFLGEGERYLEYALLPSIILSVVALLPANQPILYGWLIYSALSALFFIVQYLVRNEDTHTKNEALFEQLSQYPAGPMLPIGSFQWQALYRSSFPVVTYGTNIEEKYIPVRDYELLFSNYPFPSGDLKKVIEHFNIDYILTDRSRLEEYRREILEPEQNYDSMTELLCNSEFLQVYKVLR